jgi:hypothetical protein
MLGRGRFVAKCSQPGTPDLRHARRKCRGGYAFWSWFRDPRFAASAWGRARQCRPVARIAVRYHRGQLPVCARPRNVTGGRAERAPLGSLSDSNAIRDRGHVCAAAQFEQGVSGVPGPHALQQPRTRGLRSIRRSLGPCHLPRATCFLTARTLARAFQRAAPSTSVAPSLFPRSWRRVTTPSQDLRADRRAQRDKSQSDYVIFRCPLNSPNQTPRTRPFSLLP